MWTRCGRDVGEMWARYRRELACLGGVGLRRWRRLELLLELLQLLHLVLGLLAPAVQELGEHEGAPRLVEHRLVGRRPSRVPLGQRRVQQAAPARQRGASHERQAVERHLRLEHGVLMVALLEQ